MLFNSYIFIFLFFPLCLAGFYLLGRCKRPEAAKVWLIGFSLWFYAYFNYSYLLIILGSIGMNYLFYLGIRRLKTRAGAVRPGWLMGAGVAANLALLFYFKYFDFFIENANAVFGTSFLLKGILLPLGISFFTFQQIGFLVDAGRGEAEECGFIDYALFVSFFPQLIAGPIVSQDEMLPQFREIGRKGFCGETFCRGLFLFVMGMAKKVLVADTFGIAVNWGYANAAQLSATDCVLLIVYFSVQIYFDFSGYCDMARGIAKMFGMELPVNFNSPFQSANIVELWRRWHVTLSRFLTRYVYIPLGGNRKGRARMYFNVFMVFFLSGIWHGANWTFLVWSVLQGFLFMFTRSRQIRAKERQEKENPEQSGTPRGVGQPQVTHKTGFAARMWKKCRYLLTFLFFSVTCVFFRADSVAQALIVLGRLFQGGWTIPDKNITDAFNLNEFWYVIKVLRLDRLPYSNMYLCILITAVTLIVVFCARNAGEWAEKVKLKAASAAVTAAVFLWCVLSLSGVSSFLYFNF